MKKSDKVLYAAGIGMGSFILISALIMLFESHLKREEISHISKLV